MAQTPCKIKGVIFIIILAIAEAQQLKHEALSRKLSFAQGAQPTVPATARTFTVKHTSSYSMRNSSNVMVDKLVNKLFPRALKTVPRVLSSASAVRRLPFRPVKHLHSHTTKSSRLAVAATVQDEDSTAIRFRSTDSRRDVLPAWAVVPPALLVQLATAAQALADDKDSAIFENYSPAFVTIGALSLILVPGLFSLLKRPPPIVVKNMTFEMKGPADGGDELSAIAKKVATYFFKYQYAMTGTGDVVTFTGTYQKISGQAAAQRLIEAALRWSLTVAFFGGMASIALVLSKQVPQIGSFWFADLFLTPVAWEYYGKLSQPDEQVKVKMILAEDEKLTDLIIEGNENEVKRFRSVMGLKEKVKT
eukprot:gnl/MRDRNA2_/MRDRNA2_113917_c0_seq1.p1 gnl/MRDRNA2_/MRDRNA2_113917_c0~~gnl/MRDRNA2_/MRDRNA2_113917_c0_seq1.p1  ORF type:complete len:363 (-),score=51.79 gnl/MRDRNA2_/MRDRNA2_113917_c0_seq1:8-1096(-)